MTRQRKIVFDVIASVCAVLLLVLAAVTLVPKLIDTEVVREKLRSEIKHTAGVEIDFKQLELDLFPRPHIVIDQVSLSIPPNVKGRAASVGVSLKILALFLGKIEVTSVHFDAVELDYILPVRSDADNQSWQPLSLQELKKKIDATISSLAEYTIPNLDLQVKNASVNLFSGERKLLQLTHLDLLLEGTPAGRKLTLNCESDVWQEISVSGLLNTTTSPTTPLVTLQVNGANINVASTRRVALGLSAKHPFVTTFFDIVQGGSFHSITLKTHGESLKDLWDPGNIEVQGEVQDGAIHIPAIQSDLKGVSGNFVISHGILEGTNLQARLGNSRGKNGELRLGLIKNAAPFHLQTDLQADLSQLPSMLKHAVKDRKVLQELALFTKVKGSANGKLLLDKVAGQMKLKVEASDIHLSTEYARLSHPLQFTAARVSYDEQRIGIKSAYLVWHDMHLKISGSVKPRTEKGMWLDMDISATALDLDPLIQTLNTTGAHKRRAKTSKSESIPLEGKIRFKAERLNIGKFTWKPLHADISLKSGRADVSIKEAAICGISTPGTLKVTPPNIEFELEAAATNHELSHSGRCFVNRDFKADGRYNLKARFQGSGRADELLKKTTGELEVTAADGHIYQDAILVSVLKFLNTLEVLTGKVNFEDMGKKGFGFHSFLLKAKLHNGKFRYEEAVLRGHPMTITAAGEQDLRNGRIDLTMLAAPLVTLNRVFEHIPLIGGVLETLDTIPLGIRGSSDAVHAVPLAPSAIGYELQEMMKKSVNRPIKLIHPASRL
jgi:hypothetical protein